jgi:hypothetical protein
MRTSHLWKVVFAALALVPFLPAISVYVAVALAKINGCGVGAEEICVGGAISVSRAIVATANATRGTHVVVLVALTWLVFCYLFIVLGWKRTASRLVIGLTVTVIFAGLPYFAALPASGSFVEPGCRPNEGGFGVCGLFDGSVGSSLHILLMMVWLPFIGVPFGLLAFLAYVAVVLHQRERELTATP